MASSFLNNLANAVETGEFNSEAARKINEIDSVAEIKLKELNYDKLVEVVNDRLKESGVKVVDDNDVDIVNENLKYENKMSEIKEIDYINKRLSILINFNDGIISSINDMLEYIDVLEVEFPSLTTEVIDDKYKLMFDTINEIKNKYK